MKHLLMGLTLVLVCSLPSASQQWYEPQRGTPERAGMMDAFRPHAEVLFGPPVQFVIGDLRVSGDIGFASVSVQRPGGGQIDLYATPGWRSEYFLDDSDAFQGQALYRRSGSTWVVMHHAFGATDVWWADPALCAVYAPVTPFVC